MTYGLTKKLTLASLKDMKRVVQTLAPITAAIDQVGRKSQVTSCGRSTYTMMHILSFGVIYPIIWTVIRHQAWEQDLS